MFHSEYESSDVLSRHSNAQECCGIESAMHTAAGRKCLKGDHKSFWDWPQQREPQEEAGIGSRWQCSLE